MKLRIRHIWFLALFFVLPANAEYTVPLQESTSGNKHLTAYVDGLKVNFTLDTGCSMLSLNRQLFGELVKRGVIQWSDLSADVKEAELANGAMHDVRIFTIRRLQIGDYIMHNVRASIGIDDQPDADPLLGQSVLSRCQYYIVQDRQLTFEPKPEAEQQALALAVQLHADTSLAANKRIVNALQPYQYQLSPRYLFIYAQALEYSNEESFAISIYKYLIQSDCLYEEAKTLQNRLINAEINYAERLYFSEQYGMCEQLLDSIMTEAQKEPINERAIEYALNTRCYIYWQTKAYEKAEQATLTYATFVVRPNSWEYLTQHTIRPNDKLAKLLLHLSKWCSHMNMEDKAQRYKRMARNAGATE